MLYKTKTHPNWRLARCISLHLLASSQISLASTVFFRTLAGRAAVDAEQKMATPMAAFAAGLCGHDAQQYDKR